MLRLTDYRVLTLDCYGTLIDWEIGIWGFWCRQPTGIGDNKIWRIVKRNGILYRRHHSSLPSLVFPLQTELPGPGRDFR